MLGPLLFLIYINDISSVVSHSKMKLFADDVIIYKEIISPADAVLLQLDLSKVVQWAKKWLLHLNPEKCESIVLSNKRSPPVPNYYLDAKLISSKPVVRYLGIFVDRHLSIVNTLLLGLQGPLIFFVTPYLIALLQSNLLHINVL